MSAGAHSYKGPLEDLDHFTARELQKMRLQPPAWIVDGILPEGTSLLASAPKLGKTMFALNVAVAKAQATLAFSKVPVSKGRVLFLALEGSKAGLQRRLDLMLNGKVAPEELVIVREFPRLNDGGLETIRKYISAFSDTSLVVIDTFARVQSPGSYRKSVYDLDYNALQSRSTHGQFERIINPSPEIAQDFLSFKNSISTSRSLAAHVVPPGNSESLSDNAIHGIFERPNASLGPSGIPKLLI